MGIELTPEQAAALGPNGTGTPAHDAAGNEYVVLDRASFDYLRLRGDEQDAESARRLRDLIEEGMASPAVEAEDAFARLQAYAEKLADRAS